MKSKDLIYIAGQAPGRKGWSVQYKVKHILYHISCILRFLESEIKRSVMNIVRHLAARGRWYVLYTL